MYRSKRDMLLAALDDYKKGQGQLRQGDTYCCLGVACDLFKKETGRGRWSPLNSGDGGYMFIVEGDAEDTITTHVLGPVVREWLGFEATDFTGKLRKIFYFDANGQAVISTHLSTLNDKTQDWTEIKRALQEHIAIIEDPTDAV